MKAIQMKKHGGVEVLELTNIPEPQPKEGEVLIQLKAIGLNFIDIYHRVGRYPVPLPYIPGLEGSGIVVALGRGVTEFKIGDRVAYAAQTGGSYAEYNVVSASKLILLPDQFSFEEGAAFPLQGMTAHYLIHDYYSIKPDNRILIHAAAGGVGLLLVQWAKKLGAIVISTVSSQEKAQLAKEAGADYVIIYTEQDFVSETKRLTQNQGVDYIIDGVGKSTFNQNLEAIRVRGHICLFGSASGPAESFAPNSLQLKSINLSGGKLINHIQTREELLRRAGDVLEGIEQKWLKLKIDYIFPLEDAATAQTMLETRKTVGKVILNLT